MDNSGGNAGAVNFYTGASTGTASYALTNAQLASYLRMSIVGGNVGTGTSAPVDREWEILPHTPVTAMSTGLLVMLRTVLPLFSFGGCCRREELLLVV